MAMAMAMAMAHGCGELYGLGWFVGGFCSMIENGV
jgi:hypothetical protein